MCSKWCPVFKKRVLKSWRKLKCVYKYNCLKFRPTKILLGQIQALEWQYVAPLRISEYLTLIKWVRVFRADLLTPWSSSELHIYLSCAPCSNTPVSAQGLIIKPFTKWARCVTAGTALNWTGQGTSNPPENTLISFIRCTRLELELNSAEGCCSLP